MKLGITFTLLVSTVMFALAEDAFQNDAALGSRCIAEVDVTKDSNYQILLKNLYQVFEKRYQGMNIGEFDKRAKAWGWKRLGEVPPESGYVCYDTKVVAYAPSPACPHFLQLKLFVAREKVLDTTPYLYLPTGGVGYPRLLSIGYPPKSVLGRWVLLDSLKKKVESAGAIDSISISYQRFRYVSCATESYVFCIEAGLRGTEESDNRTVFYYVTSGLGYVSQNGEPPPAAFKGVNTLIEDPYGWDTIKEKNGERVFFCPNDDEIDESNARSSNMTPRGRKLLRDELMPK